MHHLERNTRVAVLATLQTAVAVDGGPTPEQAQLIDLVGRLVLDVDPSEVRAEGAQLDPAGSASIIVEDDLRQLVGEGLVTLELMRHPGSLSLVDRVDGYLDALGFAGPEQTLVRDAVAESSEQVLADWSRSRTPSVSTPGPDADERLLAARVEAMATCAPGTLGGSFHDFVTRHGFSYPEAHLSLIGHDFAHVLAGYEPVPEGELALQALLVAGAGGAQHASGLMASLLLFEVGLLPFPDIEPKQAVLDRPGATVLFVDGLERGITLEVDLQELDHFALADRDLVELRAELGVSPPPPGPCTFVV